MIKKLLVTILFTLFFSGNAYAADIEFSCSQSNCSPTSAPSFLENTAWYPGKSVSKTILIHNTSPQARTIDISAKNTNSTNNLDTVVSMKVGTSSNTTLWNNKLSTFFSSLTNPVTVIPAHSSVLHTYTFTMDIQAGNEFQNASTNFDLVLQVTDVPNNGGGNTNPTTTITPTPTSITPTPTSSSNSGSNSGDTSQNSSSNNTNNSGGSNSDNTAQSNTSVLGQSILTGVSTVLENLGIGGIVSVDETEVLGASESAQESNLQHIPTTNTGSITTCTDQKYWYFIPVLELLLIVWIIRTLKGKKKLLSAFVVTLLSAFIVFLIVCTKWYSLAALIPLFLLFKNLIRK